MKVRKLTQIEKFYLNTHVNKNGCWVWNGCKSVRGYGQINLGYEGKIQAHRYSYKIHYTNFNPKLNICHKCDTPSCVNPNHLFQGTQKDNMDDMKFKSRRVYKLKISKAALEFIRHSDLSNKELAIKYNVGISYIGRLRRRITRN